ncbi:FecR family protein [Brevundimonas sp.]|uniref:FecR family protein n=1 Tax=Brevundimonas sp. TaxID=1871086 RepID=UPI0037BEA369
MNHTPQSINRAAVNWLVQVNDPEFDGWEDWQAWLDQDPAHKETYWRLAAADADAVEVLSDPVVVPFRRPKRRTSRHSTRWFGMAAAASVAAVALGAGGYGWITRPQPWLVETAAGEQRALTLADGTVLQVAGATRLRLDRRNPRIAELEAGRVLFEVAHDDRRPFTLAVGEIAVTDLGTVFDVTRLADDGARVAVSEGLVRVDQDDRSLTLRPGDAVIADGQGFDRRSVALDAVGAWREGRLTYNNERVSVVADDLARALGEPVAVTPSMGEGRFSGSVTVTGDPEALRRRLELLLDAEVAHTNAGWRISGRPAR